MEPFFGLEIHEDISRFFSIFSLILSNFVKCVWKTCFITQSTHVIRIVLPSRKDHQHINVIRNPMLLAVSRVQVDERNDSQKNKF